MKTFRTEAIESLNHMAVYKLRYFASFTLKSFYKHCTESLNFDSKGSWWKPGAQRRWKPRWPSGDWNIEWTNSKNVLIHEYHRFSGC